MTASSNPPSPSTGTSWAYPGWYMNLSVGHSFKIYQEVTLDLGACGAMIGTGNYWRYLPAERELHGLKVQRLP